MVDAYSATAADFDVAAHKHAHAFWIFLIIATIVWWFLSIWWAIPPAAYAIWCAVKSVGATLSAGQLRSGKYKLYNPNNGAPDGDVANWQP